MKIVLEVADVKTLADAINNALMCYMDTISAVALNCEVHKSLEPLTSVNCEVLKERRDCLKNVYYQVFKIEQEANKNEI